MYSRVGGSWFLYEDHFPARPPLYWNFRVSWTLDIPSLQSGTSVPGAGVVGCGGSVITSMAVRDHVGLEASKEDLISD